MRSLHTLNNKSLTRQAQGKHSGTGLYHSTQEMKTDLRGLRTQSQGLRDGLHGEFRAVRISYTDPVSQTNNKQNIQNKTKIHIKSKLKAPNQNVM